MSPLGLLYAFGAAVVWGGVYTLDQQILKSSSPVVLLVINSVVTCIVFAPFLLLSTTRVAVFEVGQANWALITGSLVLAGLANLLIFSAIKSLGASVASVFEIIYPVFVVLFCSIFLKSRPSMSFLVGATLVLLGSAIIVITSL